MKKSEQNLKAVAGHVRYQAALKFIRLLGGPQAANEVITAGHAYLCVNWSTFPINVRFYFGKVAGVDPLLIGRYWSHMEPSIHDTIVEELGRACHIAFEIIDHPPVTRAA